MLSRAHLLIERDYERFLEEKPWGIEAGPLNTNNLFDWNAKICGEKGSVWEDGIFMVYMKFSECYNDVPPVIYFHTIPFHPNVDPVNGKPALDILENDENWKPEENYFGDILVAAQKLLSGVCIENAVNTEALNIYNYHPDQYREIAQQCVLHSQALEGQDCEYTVNKLKHPVELNAFSQKPSDEHKKRKTAVVKKKLLFEEYYAAWSDIGTSKSLQPKSKNKLSSTQNSSTISDFQKSMTNLQLSLPPSTENWKQDEFERINQMKQQYLHPNTPTSKTVNDLKIPHVGYHVNHFDEEVDDLISWTDKLDVTM